MRDRAHSMRYSLNHGVGRTVVDRAGIRAIIIHGGSGSIRSDGYRNWTYSNRNGLNHGVGRGVDDRDDVVWEINRHIGAGSVRRDAYPKRILICTKRNGFLPGVGPGVNDRDAHPPPPLHASSLSLIPIIP